MPQKKVNVVLVDDHVMFLNGLKSMFKEVDSVHIVAAVHNSEDLLETLRNNTVDVVITDISMPGIDGIKLNEIVKKEYPHIKMLILSSHNNPFKTNKLIKKDVDGYLLKNAETSTLIEAIHAVSMGKKYFADEVKEMYVNSFFSEEASSETKVELTKREKEVLGLIASEFSTAEIARKLYISEHTVNTHRKNLLAKLNLKNTAGLVRYALMNELD